MLSFAEIISLNTVFNWINLFLNSRPQPLDKRKSNSNLLSMLIIFALNTNCILWLSTVDIANWKRNMYFSMQRIRKQSTAINFKYFCNLNRHSKKLIKHFVLLLKLIFWFILKNDFLILQNCLGWVILLLNNIIKLDSILGFN